SRTGVKHGTLRITKQPILGHFVLAIQKGKKSPISLSLFFFLFWPRTRKRVEAVRRAADGSAFEKWEVKRFKCISSGNIDDDISKPSFEDEPRSPFRILKSYHGNMVDASRICFIVWKNMSEETLVKLTLGSHIDLGNIPPGVSLPALKSLFINTIFFTYGDLCNVLLPGCPVLEELSICLACHLILTPAYADVISRCVKRGLPLPVFKNLVALPYFPSFMFQAASCPYFRRNKPHQHLYLLKSGGMRDDGNILQTHGARWSCSIQVLD
ncbi:hypothetical protein HID58_070147, partial [Brassica napus]